MCWKRMCHLHLTTALCMVSMVMAKPNIVIFLADDLGYGDLGCYGNTTIRTPNIDSIARGGVRMTQHLAAASVCTPSRAAMLTGRYPIRSGMVSIGVIRVFAWPINGGGLPPSEITFAEQTKKAGYKNGLIGKWHLGMHKDNSTDFQHHPLNQGFDYFYGLIGTNLEDFGGEQGSKVTVNYKPYWYYELFVECFVTLTALWCFMKTKSISKTVFIFTALIWTLPFIATWLLMDSYTLLASFLHRNYEVVEQPIRLGGLSQRLVKEGREFIMNSTRDNSPFLLVMSWSHVHVFLKTAREFRGRSKHGRFGDAVEELDWSVGEILHTLDIQGVSNNTLVYFTSDNGAHLELGTDGGYNSIFKAGKTYGAPDGGIRVPGLLKWPGVVPANTVTDEPTSLMDIFNVISSAVDVNVPSDRTLDGRDILPLLKQESTVSPHEFMYHYCGDRLHAVRYRPRTGKITWKLVTHEIPLIPGTNTCGFVCSCNNAVELETPLLYDMTSDPGENHPISTESDMYRTISPIIIDAIVKHKQSIEPKPNIVIFIADDLGYGDLGCYGNTTLKTPNIDSLARDGVKLTHNVATASVCTPSRSALMTGRHQVRSGMAPVSSNGLRVNIWIASRTGLPTSEITFAELTKQAGYKNAIIGKWHLGHHKDTYGDNLHHPLNQGFDYFYGLVGTNFDDLADDGSRIVLKQRPYFNYQCFGTWAVITLALLFIKSRNFLNKFVLLGLFGIASFVCFYPFFIFDNLILLNSLIYRNYDVVEQPIQLVGLSKRFVSEGLEFMKNSTEESTPFLLVMSFSHVHTALRVSKEFEGSSKHGILGDAIHEMDWSVGKILDYLDETKQRNNTLVYFTSDHGGHKELGRLGSYNGPFKGGKAHGAPEGGIRVAGLFRWPNVLPAGRSTNAPVSLMDIYHVVSQAAGVQVPTDRKIDGRDIMPLLKGETDKSPHEFMFHYCDDLIHAVRYIPNSGTKVWKYVTHVPNYYPGTDICRFGCVCRYAIKLDQPHIYDITADPGESSPIDHNSEMYKNIVTKCEQAIREHNRSIKDVEKQFSFTNVMWRYSLQDCCEGPFPFNCKCNDTKFSKDMYE